MEAQAELEMIWNVSHGCHKCDLKAAPRNEAGMIILSDSREAFI
jgi:hypothetical protein